MDLPSTTKMDIEEEGAMNRYLTLSPTFLDFHSDGNRRNQRSIIIDWLREVTVHYKISDTAFFLAVTILDNYFSKSDVHRDSLQLIGCACLWIAEKFHNQHPCEVADYLHIVDNSFTGEQLLDAEREVLKKLEFDIWRSTWIECYSEWLSSTVPRPSPYLDWLMRHILEWCIYRVEVYQYTVPRLVEAICCIFSPWKDIPLAGLLKLARSQFLLCNYQEEIDFIFTSLMKMQKSRLKGTRNRFGKSGSRYNKESWIFPTVILE